MLYHFPQADAHASPYKRGSPSKFVKLQGDSVFGAYSPPVGIANQDETSKPEIDKLIRVVDDTYGEDDMPPTALRRVSPGASLRARSPKMKPDKQFPIFVIVLGWYTCVIATMVTSQMLLNKFHLPVMLSSVQYFFSSFLPLIWLQFTHTFRRIPVEIRSYALITGISSALATVLTHYAYFSGTIVVCCLAFCGVCEFCFIC